MENSGFIHFSSFWIGGSGIGLIGQSYFQSHFSTTRIPEGMEYYQLGYGFSMISIALLILIYTNRSKAEDYLAKIRQNRSSDDLEDEDSRAAAESEGATHAHRATVVLTCYHGAVAFYTYTKTVQRAWRDGEGGDATAYGVYANCLGSSLLFFWGVLCLVFAGEGKVSRTTGADKRTSSYPFRNAGSARAAKKEFRARSGGEKSD